MEKELVMEKFGREYSVNRDTYHMGIHHVLGDAVAKRFAGHKVCLDACVGAGFMTLPLARYVDKVIGVDINPFHLEQARSNAKTASVEDKVELISGDVLEVLKTIIKTIDSAFLDPDWAKAGDDKENHVSELSDMVPSADLLLEKVFEKTMNVCLRLPKTFDLDLIVELPGHEIQSVFQENKLKFYCIYFGDLIHVKGKSSLKA